jgi:hypothetical protein
MARSDEADATLVNILRSEVLEKQKEIVKITQWAVTAILAFLAAAFGVKQGGTILALMPLLLLSASLELVRGRRAGIIQQCQYLRRFYSDVFPWERDLFELRTLLRKQASDGGRRGHHERNILEVFLFSGVLCLLSSFWISFYGSDASAANDSVPNDVYPLRLVIPVAAVIWGIHFFSTSRRFPLPGDDSDKVEFEKWGLITRANDREGLHKPSQDRCESCGYGRGL